MSEYKSEIITNQSEVPREYAELWEEHNQNPIDGKLWEKVINLAKKEESTDRGAMGLYGDIPLAIACATPRCVIVQTSFFCKKVAPPTPTAS